MNNLRQISNIIYRLKRNYGVLVILRRLIKDRTDLETGRVSREYTQVKIKRGIVLPEKLIPTFAYDLAYIAANKNFTYGGLFGSSTRLVILDGKDVPSTFIITENDELVFSDKVHAVKSINDTAEKKGYILTVTTISSVDKVNE
jgi:hypothetical protein